MNKKVKFSSTVIIWCIILSFSAFCISIIFAPEHSKQPNKTKVEPVGKTIAVTVRQSLGFFEVTAYCPNKCCCGDYADGVAASGHVIQIDDRFCAADPSIPFGKYLDIPGYGYVPVYDRGGKIKGNKIDVFYPTHDEALEWGNQKLEIFCWVWKEEEDYE